VEEPPPVRLELRIDGATVAWYEVRAMQEASRHAVAAGHHPGSRACIEIILVDPSAGEVALMHVTPPLAGD
jgi:hypothetical protein